MRGFQNFHRRLGMARLQGEAFCRNNSLMIIIYHHLSTAPNDNYWLETKDSAHWNTASSWKPMFIGFVGIVWIPFHHKKLGIFDASLACYAYLNDCQWLKQQIQLWTITLYPKSRRHGPLKPGTWTHGFTMAWRLRHQLTKSSNLSVQRLPIWDDLNSPSPNFGDTTGTTPALPLTSCHLHMPKIDSPLGPLDSHAVLWCCATGAMRNAKRVLWQVGPWRLSPVPLRWNRHESSAVSMYFKIWTGQFNQYMIYIYIYVC